jgi:single-stranded-DNA-specific exonuclease
MAAGLSLPRDRIEAFAAAFEAEASARLGPGDRSPECESDGALEGCEATLALCDAIAQGGPWGQGFAEPVFDNVFVVRDSRVVGERHWKARLSFDGCGTVVEAIQFGDARVDPPGARVHCAYTVSADAWNGERRLQCVLRLREPVTEQIPPASGPTVGLASAGESVRGVTQDT